MLQIAFVACTMLGCKSYALTYTRMTMDQCTMLAPYELTLWTAAHPGWTISGWQCVNPSERDT